MSGPVLARETSPVLILMTDHHLGNFCLATPTIDRLARDFTTPPHLIMDRRYVPVAEMLDMPLRIESIPPRNRGMVRNLMTGAKLFTRRYAAVIDIGGGVKSATLTAMSMAPRRVGIEEFRRSGVYTDKYSRKGLLHFAEWYANLLKCIGVDEPPRMPHARVPVAMRDAVQRKIDEKLQGDRPLLVIHPGAGKDYRRWPAERFAAVADTLIEERGMRACVIGLPAEAALMEEVRAGMRHADRACCLSFSLTELVALFEETALLICNDSGPMHLATMTDVPLVAIYGPTKEERFGSFRKDNVRIVRGCECDKKCDRHFCVTDYPCLMRITTDDVLNAARQLDPMPRRRPAPSP